MPNLAELSPEVICHLFSFLQPKDLFILECTSKRLGDVCTANSSVIWKQAFYNFYRSKNNVPSIPSTFKAANKWRILCKTVLQTDLWRTRSSFLVTDIDPLRGKGNPMTYEGSLKTVSSTSLIATVRMQKGIAFNQEYALEVTEKGITATPGEKWMLTECGATGPGYRDPHAFVATVLAAATISKHIKTWNPAQGRQSWSSQKVVEYPWLGKTRTEKFAPVQSTLGFEPTNKPAIIQNINHIASVSKTDLVVWNINANQLTKIFSVPFSLSHRTVALLPKKIIAPSMNDTMDGFIVTCYDLGDSNRVLWQTSIPKTYPNSCCTNAQYITFGTHNGSIHVLKIQDGSVVISMAEDTEPIMDVDMSDEILVSYSPLKGNLSVWDLHTGSRLHIIPYKATWAQMKLFKLNNIAAFIACWSHSELTLFDPYSGAIVVSKENSQQKADITCMEITNNLISGITSNAFLIQYAIRPPKKKAAPKQAAASKTQKQTTATVVVPKSNKSQNSWKRQAKNFADTADDWDDAYDDDEYDDDY